MCAARAASCWRQMRFHAASRWDRQQDGSRRHRLAARHESVSPSSANSRSHIIKTCRHQQQADLECCPDGLLLVGAEGAVSKQLPVGKVQQVHLRLLLRAGLLQLHLLGPRRGAQAVWSTCRLEGCFCVACRQKEGFLPWNQEFSSRKEQAVRIADREAAALQCASPLGVCSAAGKVASKGSADITRFSVAMCSACGTHTPAQACSGWGQPVTRRPCY